MKLPGRTDELIERVLKVNSNICVVVQSGTPCEMPWSDRVPAIVQVGQVAAIMDGRVADTSPHTSSQAFYGGNAGGLAIGDILFGHANPSAKLPVSFTHRLEDNPSHPFYPGPHGKSLYQEDIFVGYRGLAMRCTPVLGCFGHGLSYTTFEVSNAKKVAQSVEPRDKQLSIEVDVDVCNTGSHRAGAEVVQLYIKPASTTSLPRPTRELADFQKVSLAPGESKTARFKLERDAFSYWFSIDETRGYWKVDAGKYELEFGTSSEEIKQVLVVEVEAGFEWQGL